MRKTKLTFDEHVAIGQELKAMRDRLLDIAVKVGNAYRLDHGYFNACKAGSYIDRLRSQLDNELWREVSALPKVEQFDAKYVYYHTELLGKKKEEAL